MIKLGIYALIAAAILGSIYAGVSHIRNVFDERDKLTIKVANLDALIIKKDEAITKAESERDTARTETKAANEKAKDESDLRTKIAEDAARTAAINRGNLDHALDQIARLAQRSPAYDSCLRLPIPDGVLAAPQTGPTTPVSGHLSDDASGVPGASPGARAARSIGDGLILGQHMQAALRMCNAQLEQARTWNAAHQFPLFQ